MFLYDSEADVVLFRTEAHQIVVLLVFGRPVLFYLKEVFPEILSL